MRKNWYIQWHRTYKGEKCGVDLAINGWFFGVWGWFRDHAPEGTRQFTLNGEWGHTSYEERYAQREEKEKALIESWKLEEPENYKAFKDTQDNFQKYAIVFADYCARKGDV